MAKSRHLRIEDISFPNTEKNRFYSKILIPKNDNGCMEWIGTKCSDGYGHFRNKKGNAPTAHRYSYILHYGSFTGSIVCHSCDNPKCVRPDHLFLGTVLDNIKDRDMKNRTSKGTNRTNAKLNDKDVRIIRERLKNGDTIASLSKRYEVTDSVISKVKYNQTWKHVK